MEVAVLGSPSLIVLNMVHVDVKQHLKKKKNLRRAEKKKKKKKKRSSKE